MTSTPHVRLLWQDTELAFPASSITPQLEGRRRALQEWRGGVVAKLEGGFRIELLLDADQQAELVQAIDAQAPAMPIVDVCGIPPRPGDTWRGPLSRLELLGGRALLEAKVRWPWSANRLLCRDLALLDEGLAFHAPLASWLPVVFGFNRGVESIPLFPLVSTTLGTELLPSDSEVPLASIGDFPAVGRVQIADEVIAYAALLDAPPRLSGLTRANSQQHPRGRRVWLLPGSDPRWVAADHESEVVAIRSENRQGPLVDLATDETNISGQLATIIESSKFPLHVDHAAWPITTALPAHADQWDIALSSTSAFDPLLAFNASRDSRGARMVLGSTRIRAHWQGETSLAARRFDRLLSARIVLEWSSTGFWAPDSRLLIQVQRDTASASALLGDSVPQQILAEVSGDALLPDPPDREVANPAAVLRDLDLAFDRVDSASHVDWDNADEAITPGTAAFAAWDHDDDPVVAGPLRLRVDRDQTGWSGALSGAGVLAYLRADPPQDVQLRIIVPGRVTAVATIAVGTDWTTTGDLAFDLPFDPAELLDDACVFEIEPTEPGRVDVASAWLRVRRQPPKLEVHDETEPIANAPLDAEVRSSAPFLPFELDIAALFSGEPNWELFDVSETPITLTIELINPTSALEVRVRRVRWEFDVHPATRINASPRLFCDIIGRATDDVDGLCDPIDVIRQLACDPAFGGIDAADWNGDSLDTAPLRFRAAIADGRTLDTAMERALGEAGLLASPDGETWHVAVPGSDLAAFSGGDILDTITALRVEPPALDAGRILLIRRDDSSRRDVVVLDSANPQSTAWPLDWLDAGFAATAPVLAPFAMVSMSARLLVVGGDAGLGANLAAATGPAHPWPDAMRVSGRGIADGVASIESRRT